MGLLSSGTPLGWEEAKGWAERVRAEGVEQLIHIYNRVKDRTQECLRWGDEVFLYFENLNPVGRISFD
jgi:glutamate--cysteine ligase catalytic subunit